MSGYEPLDSNFEARVRGSFQRQEFMRTLGAEMTLVQPGRVEIELPYRLELTQQHGYLHAGVSTAIADCAGGYAAYTLMPPEASVIVVEFKISLLNPARGQLFRAIGTVAKSGRRLSVANIEVQAVDGGEVCSCLVGLQTTMCLPGESDTPERG